MTSSRRCSTQASTSPRQHQGQIDNLSKGRSGLGNVLPPALLKLPIAICPRNFCKYDALAEAADCGAGRDDRRDAPRVIDEGAMGAEGGAGAADSAGCGAYAYCPPVAVPQPSVT